MVSLLIRSLIIQYNGIRGSLFWKKLGKKLLDFKKWHDLLPWNAKQLKAELNMTKEKPLSETIT